MMFNMKRMVATNKLCTYTAMAVFGAVIGMVAAKSLVEHCCCAEKLKSKAKKAFKTMEEKIFD